MSWLSRDIANASVRHGGRGILDIILNGRQHRIAVPGTTVATLLGDLKVANKRVAVERNLDVVPRDTYDQVVLAEGDRIEVVAFVGGG